jgi:hypothetical protein
MELHSNAHIPDGLLASMTLLSEKPRLGVPSWESAPHQGIDERNSTAVLGLRFRCSEIVSGTVVAPNKGNSNPTYPLLNTRNQTCGADANAALKAETGKIVSGDWVGTTAAGVVVRAVTIGGVTVSGVAQGAAISFAGRALYYGGKGLLNGATTGAACAISSGVTSLFDSLTGQDY